MRLLTYILFLNPLLIGFVNYMAWKTLDIWGLVAVFAIPVFYYIGLKSDDRKEVPGVVSYLAGLQTFFASSLFGGMVLYDGFVQNDMTMMIIGGFLLVPALMVSLVVFVLN